MRVNRLAPAHVDALREVRVLQSRPASVKDRLALNIIEAAERDGTLKPGQTVVEATSGNTGIGLAMVCAAKGYPLVVTMADSFSVERRQLMRFLGAKVVLTPRAQKGFGMYMKAKELADTHGWFLARQFETAANADIHESTTAAGDPRRLRGQAARLLRLGLRHRRHGGRRRAGAEADLAGGEDRPERAGERRSWSARASPQPRTGDGAPAGEPSAFEPHPIQGWTPDFIPLVLQEAIDGRYYDELIPIPGPEGMKWARELAAKEGIVTGVSGGSTFGVAMQVAEKAPEGSVILAMLPDTGERYLSTPLFEPFGADMNEDELEVMRSTPGYQLG